jgi:hypothetical protein
MNRKPESLKRVPIFEVWLGGRQLRHSRGQAFWRTGDGYSVSLNTEKGLCHAVVTREADSGDQFRAFRDALEWLKERVP